MSNKEFEELLNKITFLTGKNQEQISVDMGYNKGYISQMISRGKISDKFVSLLKAKYLQNAKKVEKEDMIEYDMGAAIKKMEAIQEVTLSAVAELLAKANNQSSTVVLSQLQELVNKRLNS